MVLPGFLFLISFASILVLATSSRSILRTISPSLSFASSAGLSFSIAIIPTLPSSFSSIETPNHPLSTLPFSFISEVTLFTISIGIASAIPDEGAPALLKTIPVPAISLSLNSTMTGLSLE